jgi:superfamily II DNA/RNA helicase
MELAKIPSHVTQTVQYCADADEKVKRPTTLTKIRNDETKAKKKEGKAYALCSSIASDSQVMSKILNRDHGMKCAQFHGAETDETRRSLQVWEVR